jgi:hypothetical protein
MTAVEDILRSLELLDDVCLCDQTSSNRAQELASKDAEIHRLQPLVVILEGKLASNATLLANLQQGIDAHVDIYSIASLRD